MTVPKRKRSTIRSQIFFTEPSMTHQEFKDECDVNHIMSKYSYADIQSYARDKPQDFLDLSDPIDFQLNMDSLNAAQDAFDDLPAKVRKEFNNNPVEFLTFVHNPDNREEMLRLGLLSAVEQDNLSNNNDSAKQNSSNAVGAAPSST